jgi:3-dehydro-L-gulonate-6-phosphate decarboxylase
MAFDAGADWITVIGGAATATVKEAFAETQRRGKEMLMELTGVRDIIARASEWRKIGIDRIVYHREWDAQSAGREWGEEDKATIRQLIDMGYKVTITGGLTLELLPFFGDLQASVIICGRSIREQPDPRAAARAIKQAINDIWSGSYYGAFSGSRGISLEKAAQAIRWGVSELGMTLTVDGRDCPGCNSPQRFCPDSRTDIFIPAGTNQEGFIQSLVSTVETGEQQAVGQDSAGSFYLDVGALSQLNEQKILSLLSATSMALNSVGLPGDTQAAMTVAQEIISS